jgi:hypothetical protein
MQLAMNASHAPRRCGSVACCACSKQKYSISLGAAEVGVTLINGKRVIPTSTHFGFNVLVPSLWAWLPLYQIPLCCGSLLVVSPMFGRVS